MSKQFHRTPEEELSQGPYSESQGRDGFGESTLIKNTPETRAEYIGVWREKLVVALLRVTFFSSFLIGTISIYAYLRILDSPLSGYILVSIGATVGFIVVLGLFAFLRLPYRLRAYGTVLIGFILYLWSLLETGIIGEAGIYLMVFVVFAFMLLGWRAGVVAIGIGILSMAAVGWGVLNQRIFLVNPNLSNFDYNQWIFYGIQIFGVITMVAVGVVTLQNAFATAYQRERQVSRELLKERAGLEKRVEERTHALQISSEISRNLSNILEQERLIQEVVLQLQEAFGYYHVHIYLIDEDEHTLNLVGGTGLVGQAMLESGHSLARAWGLVGRAAETNQPVLSRDVSQNADWIENPLLPETRSELAVPISLGDDVLGVLDVQHNIRGGLDQQDIYLTQAIASQVAVALQNAFAFRRVQKKAQREVLTTSIGQRIQSAVSIDEALKVAVRELGQATGAKIAQVELNLLERADS